MQHMSSTTINIYSKLFLGTIGQSKMSWYDLASLFFGMELGKISYMSILTAFADEKDKLKSKNEICVW